MNKEQFFEEVLEAVRNQIPQVLRDEIEVSVREVVKTNDEVLHGISVMLPETNCAPTIYMEDCYKDYEDGMTIDEIAENIMSASIAAYKDAPTIEEFALEYDDIQSKLTIQVVDSDMNKGRLKDLVYQPVGNGFVAIPYIVVREDDHGRMMAAVSKTMAKEMEYDIDKLLETAFANTTERNEPVLFGMGDMLFAGDRPEIANPMKDGFEVDPNLGMYVLTNTMQQNGASVLFYPDMQKRIGEILGKDYYVLPSSLHEVIIVPEGTGPTLKELQTMVKEANRTVVEPQEVLSDKVLYFDRERERLIEPKTKERDGEERGDR